MIAATPNDIQSEAITAEIFSLLEVTLASFFPGELFALETHGAFIKVRHSDAVRATEIERIIHLLGTLIVGTQIEAA